MIKINFDKNSDKVKDIVQLVKFAAQDGEVGSKARAALAALAGPVITQVLEQKASHRAFYELFSYDFGTAPSIPLDLFQGNSEGLIDVWSAAMPGGLATNHIQGGEEFRMTTFPYDSAFSMLKRNAENGRFELYVKGLERMAQEIMVKEKFQAWGTMLRALGAARTNGSPHVISATASGVFQMADINKLKTKVARLRTSWINGTPENAPGQGFTHLVASPEIMEQVRSWVYEPGNTRPGSLTTSGATAIALPEAIRNSIFSNSGLTSIPGVANFIELNELGVNQAYNAIFDSGYTAGVGEPAFANASDEIVVAVDLSLPGGVRATATDSDRSSEIKVEEDDQFTKRAGRIGWYGKVETGYAWMDNKTLSGVIC